MYEGHYHAPKDTLLSLIKVFSESFYKQIEKERTLDDCCVSMHYTWHHGEKTKLDIDVRDKTYITYSMPY